ncbi:MULTISPECIES: hypothetical protein [Streptomyces]|uniref:hypothetical protein n=1 Tax=Streptomyces TaxID=1883 RepID=UPI00131B8196|nr:hypothetical protein [Streptomyces sp. NRRL F-5193]
MSRFLRTAAAVSTAVVAAGLLAGCAETEQKAVPTLPERICWGGAFAGGDVAPLLPPGDQAEFSRLAGRPFVLTEDIDSQTCTLYIDGRTRFQAVADFQEFEDAVDWSSWDSADPEPLDVGDKGIVWDTGAASYFTCEPAKNPKSPGQYIELRISLSDPPDTSKLQAALPELMKDFMTFAQSKLQCPGGSAGR